MNQDLQASFRALSDPTRRAILRQLCNEELTISEVVGKFHLTRTAVRKHLTILEEGNLISVTARGKERVTSLNLEGIKATADWFNYFDRFWDTALNSLKHAIDSSHRKKPTTKRKR